MKKLMFAAAICLAAVAAYAEVATFPLKFGFQVITPVIGEMDDEGKVWLSLNDISITGEASDKVFIKTIDGNGQEKNCYQWNTWAVGEGSPAWVTSDFEPVEGEVKFEAGHGFVVQCNTKDPVNLVMKKDSPSEITSVEIPIGGESPYTLAGNPFTEKLDLLSIDVVEGSAASYSVAIYTVDAAGQNIGDGYTWGEDYDQNPCWIKDGWEPVLEPGITFDSGVGLRVVVEGPDYTLRITK